MKINQLVYHLNLSKFVRLYNMLRARIGRGISVGTTYNCTFISPIERYSHIFSCVKIWANESKITLKPIAKNIFSIFADVCVYIYLSRYVRNKNTKKSGESSNRNELYKTTRNHNVRCHSYTTLSSHSSGLLVGYYTR